jgi:hypothetical protein
LIGTNAKGAGILWVDFGDQEKEFDEKEPIEQIHRPSLIASLKRLGINQHLGAPT